MHPIQTQTQTQLSVEDISKSITTRSTSTLILDHVTFSVQKGQLFCINGPSGSGKSTLLNIMTGIDRPSGGRMLFAGQELRYLNENQLARWRGRHVGIVFQFFQLLPTLTALENILLALELAHMLPRASWHARALECLDLVGLAEYAQRFPAELSGGQQQRVAIARALANDPPVLFADEPTGNLDTHTALRVFDLLRDLTRRGKTVIYVTHDRELAALASQHINLVDGRLASAVPPLARREQ